MPRIIAVIIETALFGCALWALFFLSALLHEAGHALGCMIAARDRHWHIRVGSGKVLWNTKRLTVKLLPFDGCFMLPEKNRTDTKAKLIAMLSGGPAVSLILTAGLLWARLGGISPHSEIIVPGAVESLINSAFYINLFILILSLIPTRYFFGEIKGMETDGLQIVNALRSKEKNKK